MGSTSYGYTLSNNEAVKAEISRIYTYETAERKEDVLDIALAGGVAYLAVRRTDRVSGETSVLAGVCLYRNVNDSDGFGYRDMTENSGPLSYDCPDRIMRLLTPTTHEYALGWRQGVAERKAANRAKASKTTAAKKALTPGSIVRFREPLSYSISGSTVSVAELEYVGTEKRTPLFRSTQEHLGAFRFRVRRETLANAEIVSQAA
jgi:hypothetical protein